MKARYTLFYLLLMLAIPNAVKAQVASYSSYTGTGINNYNVNFWLFRDCIGLELCAGCVSGNSPSGCNISLAVTGGVLPAGIVHNIPSSSATYTNTFFGSYNLAVVPSASAASVTENGICSTSICDNCNTRTPGSLSPGLEAYRFTGVASLSTVPLGACWLSFSYIGAASRPSYAKSIASNTPFVLETFVNRCLPTPNNSSVFSYDHRISNCAGQESFIPFKCTDPDGDSLSYRLAPILQAPGVNAVYTAPFSAQIPFPHLGAGAPPNPPLGLTIDSKNGWIRFTPLGSFKESFVIEVLEWRKVNGLTTLAGITRYDMPIFSENCNGNQPAIDVYYQNNIESASKSNWNVCVDEHEPVCFIMKSKSINTPAANTTLNADTNQFFVTTRYSADSIKICMSSLAINNQGSTPYIINLLAKEQSCPTLTQRGRTLTIQKYNKPSQLLRAKSNGNFNRTLFLEALNTTPIFSNKTIWQIESAPNSQQYNTLTIGDTCKFQFPGHGFYNIRTVVEGACVSPILHILQVETFSVKDSILQQVLCKNSKQGKVQAITTNAIGPLKYKLNNDAYQSSPIFDSLTAGNYLLMAEDSIGQKDSIVFTITQPAAELKIDSTITQNPACYGGNQGSIQVFASGGTAPISFGLNQSNFNPIPIFQNLSAGEYLVQVVDNNNCLASDTIEIFQPNPLVIDFLVDADNCTNPPSGKITANITGGTQPYFLNWLNVQQSGQTEIDKLPSGNYYLRVADQKNCITIDTAFVPLSNETFAEQICTINCIEGISGLAEKHEIKWQKNPDKRIASYQIWSAPNDTAPFSFRKTILASAAPSFIDSININPYWSNDIKYKILTIDSCGRSSAFSNTSSSLVLTVENSSLPWLTWQKPNTQALATEYEIYRRSWSSPTYNLIKTLDSNQFSFIDTNFHVDGFNLFYYVKAKVINNCQVNEIRSPDKDWVGLSISKFRGAELGISLFPNPAKQKVNILSKSTASFNTIKIYNLQGSLIQTIELDQATKNYELALPPLAKGMYYISLSNQLNPPINLPLWVE